MARSIGYATPFEVQVLLLGAASVVVLVPLRGMSEGLPVIRLLGAFSLFMIPGLLLTRRFLAEHFPGMTLVPLSFTISVGIFGLAGVPMLILHLSTNEYLGVCAVIVTASLALAALGLFSSGTTKAKRVMENKDSRYLWGPFLLLAGALASVSQVRSPIIDGDTWVYLAYVRAFERANRLAVYNPYTGDKVLPFSRVKIDGWLLIQAALSRVSGIDPIELALRYLTPILILLTLLAFYCLARLLFESRTSGLVAACVYALFFLVYLNPSINTFGGELVGRVIQDKFAARFIFLPVALALAFAFLKSKRKRYLLCFGFICWSVCVVHPVVLGVIAISMAGFAIVYLALNWRDKRAWIGIATLAMAGASVVILPSTLIFLLTGHSLSAFFAKTDINDTAPAVIKYMVFLKPAWKHIYKLGNGLYMMNPSLILNRAILASYVLGIPFLLWRLKRSLAAQLLFGTLIFTGAVVYIPQVATFVGNNLVLPGQLWRLAWPIPLAAMLTLGWIVSDALRWLQSRIKSLDSLSWLSPFAPLVLVCMLVAATSPASVIGLASVYHREGLAFDPIYRWMEHNIKKPGVVLAPARENLRIPAFSTNLNVISVRGKTVLKHLDALQRLAGRHIRVPRGALDDHRFFSGSSLKEDMDILQRNKVDYLLLYANTPLDRQISHLPGFTRLDTPGAHYSLYVVNRSKLAP